MLILTSYQTAPWPLLAVGFGIYGFGFVVCVDIALSYLTDSYQDVRLTPSYEPTD
jgi:hypothetical protein